MGERLEKWPGLRRSAVLEITRADGANGENDPALYDVTISSEYEVKRWMGIEVLGHGKGEVDLSRLKDGAALLLNHDPDRQIGVVEEASLDVEARKVRGRIRFSRGVLGREVEQDVKDGIRRQISVGYQVERVKLIERSDGDEGKIDKYRITRWLPYEVSVVSVAADPTVGVGRGETGGEFPVVIEDGGSTVEEGERIMPEKPKEDAPVAGTVATRAIDGKDAAKEVREIVKLARAHGFEDRIEKWLDEGKTLDEVRIIILDEKTTRGTAVKPEPTIVRMPEKDAKAYSYARAIMGALERRAGGKFDGLEREVHDEIASRLPAGYASQGGVFVPISTGKRALDTKTLGKGAEMLREEQGELIELLRNRAVVVGKGARVLSGLGAPIAFTKQKSGMTFYWIGENPAAAVTASDLGLGLALLSPKTLMGQGSFSRQLLLLGNPDVEGMVRDEIANGHALAIDKGAIHGLGAAGQPTGIYVGADVNSKAMGGVPSFALLVDMQTEVAKDNADLGTMGWVTTPGMAGKMRQTLVASAAGSEMIWQGTFRDGVMVGYPAAASNQISSLMTGSDETGGTEHGIIFGNWSSLVIGMFSAMELIVDPYTDAGKAMIRITSFQMADILARHGESFCKATGATIA